jgi:cystathionine beta-lyase/cystathionine gamma-synthase
MEKEKEGDGMLKAEADEEGRRMRMETLMIHAGQEPDPLTGAVSVPIYLTSTYAQEAPGKHKGYDYSRTRNPTRQALESCIAALEGASHGFAFASGMAAISTVLNLLSSGDHILAISDLYGGTRRIFDRVYSAFGISVTYLNEFEPRLWSEALRPETRLIWVETPTNPLLRIVDISAVARWARQVQASQYRPLWVTVDNTFATPYLQQPLSLGAHIVVHSSTKYLGGHSDIIGGAIAVNDPDLASRIGFIQNAVGAVPSPVDCFLVLRGIKTLAVRMDRHCENAQKIAAFLKSHPAVTRVHYPGLAEHPGHEVARRQMRAFGGMVSFEVSSLEIAEAMMSRTRLFTLAESLGGVESLIESPALMTHASIAPEERAKAGLSDSLIRLSVGIENVDDLIEDLAHALE